MKMLGAIALIASTQLGAAQGRRSEPKPIAPIVEVSRPVTEKGAFCGPHRTTIVSLADRILAERDELKGFGQKQYGTLAAYMILQQKKLDLGDGLALLASLPQEGLRRPRQLGTLELLFLTSKLGVDAGLGSLGREAVEEFARASTLVHRQIILADEGASFFRLLKEVREDPALNKIFEQSFFAGMGLGGKLQDRDDAVKLAVAQRAITAGEITMAGVILGSRRDLSEYYALDADSISADVPMFPKEKHLTQYTLTGLSQSVAPTRNEPDPARRLSQQADFEIIQASMLMEGMAWLSIVYNQTGLQREVAAASRAFMAALQNGEFDPKQDMEKAWLYLADALSLAMGQNRLAPTLGSFDLSKEIRHYAGRAGETLDWMRAIVALEGYMRGTDDEFPPTPVFFAKVIDWKNWESVAQAVRLGDTVALEDDDQRQIAVELLYRAGDVLGAVEMAARITTAKVRLRVYRDLMRRLDLRCDEFMHYPGGALSFGGMAVMTFQTQ